jgi:hypothetical protein
MKYKKSKKGQIKKVKSLKNREKKIYKKLGGSNIIIVRPMGGLGNKLRVMFSYYLFAKKEKKYLQVIWNTDAACPGLFLDYFLPIKGTEFIPSTSKPIDFMSDHWHNDFNPYKQFIYQDLQINNDIKSIISKNKKLLGKYIAVHIRRTDHSNLAKKNNRFTEDIDFIRFINKYPKHNVYIATDNKETQMKFYNMYKDRIKVITFIKDLGTYRQTSVKEAIIDLYMCVNSNHFKNSGYSSFSDLILQLRENNVGII